MFGLQKKRRNMKKTKSLSILKVFIKTLYVRPPKIEQTDHKQMKRCLLCTLRMPGIPQCFSGAQRNLRRISKCSAATRIAECVADLEQSAAALHQKDCGNPPLLLILHAASGATCRSFHRTGRV